LIIPNFQRAHSNFNLFSLDLYPSSSSLSSFPQFSHENLGFVGTRIDLKEEEKEEEEENNELQKKNKKKCRGGWSRRRRKRDGK
jgi:hypothetical protein